MAATIIKGSSRQIIMNVKLDGVYVNLTGATITAQFTSGSRATKAWTNPVTLLSTDVGANWPIGKVAFNVTAALTVQLTSQQLYAVELKIVPATGDVMKRRSTTSILALPTGIV